MILVTSGAYVDAEFRNEFGALPPALLPIGNRRLFQHQAELIARSFDHERRFLSLPESFVVSEVDQALLDRCRFEVVRVPEPLSLGESVLMALNAIGAYDEAVRILHGDTLLAELPLDADAISIAPTTDQYEWEFDDTGVGAHDRVWCGFFAFSRPRSLIRCLVRHRGSFVAAVRSYDAEAPMRRLDAVAWKDFGHINTYYRARKQITTERAFNSLSVQDRRVTKAGENDDKIRSEARWFAALPPAMKVFTPQLLESGEDAHGRAFYSLEYLCLPPLNEIFVHGANPPAFWRGVFDEIDRWLQLATSAQAPASTDVDSGRRVLLADKCFARVEAFARQTGFKTDAALSLNGEALPSLQRIAEDCATAALGVAGLPGVLHGDLCFSNILYDSRSGAVKVIDPRGLETSQPATLWGDVTYDIAKLAHSVLGLYDHILAGVYRCRSTGPVSFEFAPRVDERVQAVQALFRDYRFAGGHAPSTYAAQMVLLFISMLPLHYDDEGRQRTLLANALRLYRQHFARERAP